jgi:superfamily II DNA or RNA helicase
MQLHAWQIEALSVFKNQSQLIANVCTGAGKTIYAIEVIKYVRELNPEINILIVAPKIVILETVWLKELYKAGYGPNLVGVYYGYAHEFSKITLTTIASINRLDMRIFDLIIADEIHNMMAPNLIKLLKHPFKYKLGLSASIKHYDQRHWKLIEYFGYNVYEYNMRQAIKDGIINKFNFYSVGVRIKEPEIREKYERIDLDLKQYLLNCGGFERIMRLPKDDPTKIAVLGLFTQRNDLINNYLGKIEVVCDIIGQNRGKKILLFSQYNKINRGIYWALKEKITRAEIIDTNIKQALREKFLKQFENGDYDVLLSSRIFEEGYNLPAIDCAIFLSSNSTSRQMIQRLGRILRKKDKPSDAYYIYCKDTFEEDYAIRAREFVQDVAEKSEEVEY